MRTAELLQRLVNSKNDIREAIWDKGVNVVGGMEDFPSSIDLIKIDDSSVGPSAIPFMMENIWYSKTGVTFGDDRVDNPPGMEADESGVIKMYTTYPPCYYNQDMNFMGQVKMTKCGSITMPDDGDLVSISNYFMGCQSLYAAPYMNTNRVSDIGYLFSGLEVDVEFGDYIIPGILTNENYFHNLMYVPYYDFSNVSFAPYTFMGCINLQSVPDFDMSNCVAFDSMFKYCWRLKKAPRFRFGNATEIEGFSVSTTEMFYNCTSLPEVDYSYTNVAVESCDNMFSYCTSLKKVNLSTWDFSNTTSIRGMVEGCESLEELYMGNLPIYRKLYLGCETCPNLTTESIVGLLNKLPDINDLSGYEFKIGAAHLAKLSDDQIEIATNKGWNLI